MISLRLVSKNFGPVQAVQQVSLEIPPGGRLVILGPSGSGKTTLLRLIAGLEIPDSGTIYLNDRLVSQPGWALAPNQRGLGYMFQTPALWPHLTVAQNIRFGLHKLPKIQVRDRLRQIMQATRIEQLAERYPHQLSGGEARRVALARTLAPQPRILLLDEPLANLDPDLQHQILDLILETASAKELCLIWVTHNREEAALLGSQKAWMDQGIFTIDDFF